MTPAEVITANVWRSQRPRRLKMVRYASYLVHSAVKRSVLPPVETLACVDCGNPASTYDHRFYTRPLDVEPVCGSCNKKRGHAWDLEILCADMGEPL